MTDHESTRDPQHFVRALARGLAVLEALGGQPRGRSLSDIAKVCELDRATARRLLLTLEELGYVCSEDGRFSLAPRALSLGYAYLSSFPFWDIARPLMAKLVEELKENCSAATLDGPYATYVARIRSNPHIVDVSRTVGSRVPAYCTSLGRVLLAAQPVERQRALLKQLPLVRNTPMTVVDPTQLMEILAQVQEQGWALVDQELEPNLRSLAVPVYNREQKVVAALNVSVPEARATAEEMVTRFKEPLLTTAAELSAALKAREIS